MSVTQSHSLSIGIVGLPNAGKSTLFNSITSKQVDAQNYPFCTIDKNVGVVEVPDRRLDKLENFFNAKKKVPSLINFVDIAGLVKGASKGEGLGNKFLAHIREVDVIVYLVRGFSSETISHVYERVNPVEDLEIVQSELILKDIETIDKRIHDWQKNNRVNPDKDALAEKALYDRIFAWLGEGKPAVEMPIENEKEILWMRDLWLLTAKKRVFLMNIQEGFNEEKRDQWFADLEKFAPDAEGQFVKMVDVKLMGEMANLDEEGKKEYLELLGTTPFEVEDLIRLAFERLNLVTFYTGSESEVNAWSIEEGTNAKDAAGVIHTDLSKGFITADVVNVDEMIDSGGLVQAREKGIVRNQGKEYIVKDGDYILIHSSK